MNNKFLFSLVLTISCACIFPHSIKADNSKYLSSKILESYSQFVVIGTSLKCVKGLRGSDSTEIVKTFNQNETLIPKRWQEGVPYSEYNNKTFLWVSYNDALNEGCYVEANSQHIKPTGEMASKNIPPSQTEELTDNKPIIKSVIPHSPSLEHKTKMRTKKKAAKYDSGVSENIKCTTTNSSSVRYIETNYEKSNSPIPCQVIYYKDNGSSKTIADSQYTEGYCEEKRSNLVEKLKAWGWVCE